MTVSTFALGALAQPVFGLGFVDAALTVICINILGILPVSFFSTFGPRFGLRQMVVSRFFFGYYGVKLSEFVPHFLSTITGVVPYPLGTPILLGNGLLTNEFVSRSCNI